MRKLPCVTPRAGVEIRGVYGQPVFEFFQQVRAILALGGRDNDLGQFFAEPQLNAAKGEIYWYSNCAGPVQPYFQLSQAARDALDGELLEIRRRIRVIGERFAAEGGSASGNRTEMFKAMMSATDLERCLFLVGTQPVLCEWGCKPIGAGASPVDLWSYSAATAAAGGAPQPATAAASEVSVNVTPPAMEESAGKDGTNAIGTACPPSAGPARPAEKLPENVAKAIPRNPVAPNKVVSAPANARPAAPPPLAHAPIGEVRANTGGAARYRHVDPARASFDFWNFLKKLIIAGLLLLLVLLLLKGCSDHGPVILGTHAVDSREDESRLRKEIVELRRVAAGVLGDCPGRNEL